MVFISIQIGESSYAIYFIIFSVSIKFAQILCRKVTLAFLFSLNKDALVDIAIGEGISSTSVQYTMHEFSFILFTIKLLKYSFPR